MLLAQAEWAVCYADGVNIAAYLGIAICEFSAEIWTQCCRLPPARLREGDRDDLGEAERHDAQRGGGAVGEVPRRFAGSTSSVGTAAAVFVSVHRRRDTIYQWPRSRLEVAALFDP